jgi:hypothetical protein
VDGQVHVVTSARSPVVRHSTTAIVSVLLIFSLNSSYKVTLVYSSEYANTATGTVPSLPLVNLIFSIMFL